MGPVTTPGDFTWTATPADKLTFAIDTLVNPTTVGTDIARPMADFDPSQRLHLAGGAMDRELRGSDRRGFPRCGHHV